jgi:hypothetical protein
MPNIGVQQDEFQNKMQSKIAGSKEHLEEGLIKLHKEKPQDACPSLNIIRMNKPRRMRSADHVAYMMEMGNEYRMLYSAATRKT